MNPRLGALLSALGGGCVGIPLFFQQKTNTTKIISVEASKTEPPVKTEIIQKPEIIKPPKIAQSGNCTFTKINEFDELDSILWVNPDGFRDLYAAFVCDSTGKDEDKQIPNNWTGLFPRELLKGEGKSLNDGDKREININTESLSDRRNSVTFTGNVFDKPPVTGKWDETNVSDEGKTVIKVSVMDNPKLLYIVFEGKLKGSI